jgi:hypothetical protein
MIVSFDIRGNVHVDLVPESLNVNQVYYKVLTNLREWVRRRPEMWKNGSWVLHQDKVPAQNALSVKTFLTKHKITVLEHPPTFFFFSKDHVYVKRNQVQVHRCSEGKSDGAHE